MTGGPSAAGRYGEGVIIWINGAFGSGKTQTAHELARRLGSAHVADPELIGIAVNRMVPAAQRADFQDRPQWRSAVAATLGQIDAADPDAVTIVPMTLVDPDYFDDIVGTLRRSAVDIAHITLQASPETLHARLRGRTSVIASALFGMNESWAIAQISRCTEALADATFATHVVTDHLSLDEVVEQIADRLGLALTGDRLPAVVAKVRRLWVSAAHIRP